MLMVTIREVSSGRSHAGRSGSSRSRRGRSEAEPNLGHLEDSRHGVEDRTDPPRADVHAERIIRGITDDRGLHPVRPVERPSGRVDEHVEVDQMSFQRPRKFDRVGIPHRVGRGSRDAAMRLFTCWFWSPRWYFGGSGLVPEDHDLEKPSRNPITDGVRAVFSKTSRTRRRTRSPIDLEYGPSDASTVAFPLPWLDGPTEAQRGVGLFWPAPTVAATRLFDPAKPTVRGLDRPELAGQAGRRPGVYGLPQCRRKAVPGPVRPRRSHRGSPHRPSSSALARPLIPAPMQWWALPEFVTR